MLVRVGSTEADVKVAAVMSVPRLGFTDNMFCVAGALAPLGIAPTKVCGAFWGQALQNAIEQVIDDHDVILTIDYDTVFSPKTVEALLTLMMYSGYDAIAPLQIKRDANSVMFANKGTDVHGRYEVADDWFDSPVQPVESAHFGLTFIRTSAIKRMPKPWFLASANDKGMWDGGHMDEDLYFWKQLNATGGKLGVATGISVGHAELMITWPSRTSGTCKVQQHPTEFWQSRMPPEDSWGVVQ